MDPIMANASSSAKNLMREFSVITNNIANASTIGFKRQINKFTRAVKAQQGNVPGGPDKEIDLTSVVDFSQGGVLKTGRPLDFAIMGKGFFVIESPDGTLYTRKGVFLTNTNGQLVDSEGQLVMGKSGPITIPPNVSTNELSVSCEGSISANGVLIDKFKLVDFKEDENKLQPSGLSCYTGPKGLKPEPAQNVMVRQGYQEASNVRIIDEMVDMIMVTRLYESNLQFITAKQKTSSSLMNLAMG